jgi:prevent-host-death family protein
MFKNGDETTTEMVSALAARSHFGKLLRRIEENNASLVIVKRGTPKAVLLSIRDYVRLAASRRLTAVMVERWSAAEEAAQHKRDGCNRR